MVATQFGSLRFSRFLSAVVDGAHSTHTYIFRMPGDLKQPHDMVEGSLEVKLSTIWTVGKAEVGRVREEKRRREKIREEKE